MCAELMITQWTQKSVHIRRPRGAVCPHGGAGGLTPRAPRPAEDSLGSLCHHGRCYSVPWAPLLWPERLRRPWGYRRRPPGMSSERRHNLRISQCSLRQEGGRMVCTGPRARQLFAANDTASVAGKEWVQGESWGEINGDTRRGNTCRLQRLPPTTALVRV